MKISFDALSPQSVEEAKKQLESLNSKVDSTLASVISQLTQEGCDYMKSVVKRSTGELSDSISSTFDESTCTGRISVGSDYAIFVEYGTGIKGATSPHPNPAPDWVYDSNNHGAAGWWYFDKKAQKLRWTQGQPANAFVYKTAQYLKQRAKELTDKELRVIVNG